MKRLVRSIIDPVPRSVSLKGLSVVVGMLLCGIGISVHEYLESGRPAVRPESPALHEGGACRRDACRTPSETTESAARRPEATLWTEQGQETSPGRPTPSVAAPAATQWVPEDDAPARSAEETSLELRSETTGSRIGTVSGQ